MSRVDDFSARTVGGTQQIWKLDGLGPVLFITAGQLGFAEKMAAALSRAWLHDETWARGVPLRVIGTSPDAADIAAELALIPRFAPWNIVADGLDIVALNPRITDEDLEAAQVFVAGWDRRAARGSIAAAQGDPRSS